MKTALLPLALFCAVTVPVAAHADTLYTVTDGQLTTPYLGPNVVGSYSGTFTLNSYFTILSGSFSATVNGVTYNNLNMIVGNNPTSGYAAFFDAAGDHLNFALFGAGSATNPPCAPSLSAGAATLSSIQRSPTAVGTTSPPMREPSLAERLAEEPLEPAPSRPPPNRQASSSSGPAPSAWQVRFGAASAAANSPRGVAAAKRRLRSCLCRPFGTRAEAFYLGG